MKLVHIITGLQVGGAEIFLLRLAERLAPMHEMEVISLSSHGQLGGELAKLGIPVTALDMKPGWPDPVKFVRLVLRLRRVKPDLVHTWMYHADLAGGLAARIAGVPTVVWAIHYADLSPRVIKRSTLLVARACASLSRFIPDRVVCVAESAREKHVRLGYQKDRMLVVPNGFDVTKFCPDPEARGAVRAELGLDDGIPLVGCIARFDLQKGHETFVETAAILRTHIPQARFLLAGRDVDARNCTLVHWLESRNLADAVSLLGYRSDVSRLMAALDALLLPSIGEGMPLVVGEAMASGVPCVVTDVGDTALLVEDTGFVRPPGDAEGLAEALMKLLEMPREERIALGARARQRIVENFEIGAIVRCYDDMYRVLTKTENSA